MTQGFAKKNSFSSVYLDNLCKYCSDEVTISSVTGDLTVTLPFDWTGGYVKVIRSDDATDWSEDTSDAYIYFESSYDALTNTGTYTDKAQYGAVVGAGGSFSLTKGSTGGSQKTGNFLSATATTITFKYDNVTTYLKYFVWAPYTATIQMDGSNIVLSGSGIPTSTPEFVGQQYIDITAKREYKAYGTSSSADWLKVPVYYSGTTTITNADVTITLPWDWSGGTLEIHKNTTEADYFGNSDSIIRTSYISLTSATYTGKHLLYTGPTNTVNVLSKSTDNNGSPKSATSTSFTLDNNGTTTYIKYFVWA